MTAQNDPDAGGWTPPRRLAGATLAAGPVPPATRFRRHEHEGFHVCCVASGGFVESHPWGPEDVGPGTVRVSAAARHDIDFGPAGARCVLLELDAAASAALRSAPPTPLFLRDPWLEGLAARIGAAALGGDSREPELDGLVAELLAQVVRRCGRRADPTPPPWLRHARELVHDAPLGPPPLAQLAAELDVHPVHLARAFRDHFGVTIGAYARRLRVERARRLLLHGDEPLARVAVAAGFSDQSHMTREVRAALGTTPARLRGARFA
jgi:AraC family transcriptional regulator